MLVLLRHRHAHAYSRAMGGIAGRLSIDIQLRSLDA